MFSLPTPLLLLMSCEESPPLPNLPLSLAVGTASKLSINVLIEGFTVIVWFHLWEDVCAISIRIFCSQQKPPWYIGLTQHRQLAMAAACDFCCTGDKSFPQMSTSLWHLAPCDLSHPISLNGHTTLAHHDNWGQSWTTAWGQTQRQAGGGGTFWIARL